jgi:hypothetical protein
MARIACLLALLVAACGSTSRPFDDGGVDPPDDAMPFDAEVPDAVPQLPPTPSREFVGGAGRVSGATYTFDVEIGHPIGQQPASGATYTMEGNAAVKP